jgi:selenide,water dikinase
LYLTKPLGIGILTTAEKKGKLRAADVGVARDWMCTLNKPGSRFGKLAGVTAMTDVTGFGLLGHLVEMADGSQLTARVAYDKVPRLDSVEYYLDQGCVPGGTLRNFDSYSSKVGRVQELHKRVLCDPQTSGGLLIAVTPEGNDEFLAVAAELGLNLAPIGELVERQTNAVEVI